MIDETSLLLNRNGESVYAGVKSLDLRRFQLGDGGFSLNGKLAQVLFKVTPLGSPWSF